MELKSIESICPVCGDVAEVDAANFLKCSECGLNLLASENGLFSAEFDKAVVGYPEDGSVNTLEIEDRSFWFAHRHGVIGMMLGRFSVDGIVVDVGGGNGFEARKLQEAFSKTVLVEPSLPGCRAARLRGVRNVVYGTLESLKIRAERIAGACFFDVLEHLDNPQILLSETYRILEANGRIFITVPAFNWLWSGEDDYAEHKRRYSKRGLIKELECAGYTVDYISYYFLPLVVPIFIFRTLPGLLGKGNVKKMNKDEHSSKGFVQKIVNGLLNAEAHFLRSGRTLPFGSSLVCVARKVGGSLK